MHVTQSHLPFQPAQLQTKLGKKQFLKIHLLGMLTERKFFNFQYKRQKFYLENFRLISQRWDILQNNL